jgi:hypothetical protein
VVSWRTPNTYLTAGAGRGPPPQLLRDPGQPRRKKTLQMEVIGLWGVRPGLAEAAAHVVVGLFRRRG